MAAVKLALVSQDLRNRHRGHRFGEIFPPFGRKLNRFVASILDLQADCTVLHCFVSYVMLVPSSQVYAREETCWAVFRIYDQDGDGMSEALVFRCISQHMEVAALNLCSAKQWHSEDWKYRYLQHFEQWSTGWTRGPNQCHLLRSTPPPSKEWLKVAG